MIDILYMRLRCRVRNAFAAFCKQGGVTDMNAPGDSKSIASERMLTRATERNRDGYAYCLKQQAKSEQKSGLVYVYYGTTRVGSSEHIGQQLVTHLGEQALCVEWHGSPLKALHVTMPNTPDREYTHDSFADVSVKLDCPVCMCDLGHTESGPDAFQIDCKECNTEWFLMVSKDFELTWYVIAWDDAGHEYTEDLENYPGRR